MNAQDFYNWMITEKLAKNSFNASAIWNGLELWKLPTDEARKERCKLYREWRWAGEKSAVAFENAKAGTPAPKRLLEVA